MKRRSAWLVLVLAVLLAACGGTGGASSEADTGAESADEAGAARGEDVEASGTSAGGQAAGVGFSSAGAGGDAAQEEGASGGEAERGTDRLGSLDEAAFDDKIIREGTVTIEVGEGAFDRALLRVSDMAQDLGGAVVSMNTGQSDDQAPSGSVTVRVPTQEYDTLISGVGGIGKVRGRKISSRDVTTEYVDLRSRLRHAEAQERFYLGLLNRAQDVQDAIAVQQQLDGITTEIERLRGRLRFLDARTAYSTLTVALFEPGAPPIDGGRPATEPSLARYWETAEAAFVTVVGSVMVTVVSLLPLLVLLVLAFVAWRLLRGRNTPGPAPRPAE